ncbi:LuxR family transcriptional regulator [Nesterenkonia suensis]
MNAARTLRSARIDTLVIDAYEHLGSSIPQVDRELCQLLELLPPLRVIIAARCTTTLQRHEADQPDRVRVSGPSELQFTLDEVRQLLGHCGISTSEETARTVLRASGGLPLAVDSLIQVLSQLETAHQVHTGEWMDVIAKRLEAQLPPSVTPQLLADACIPPYLDNDLAARIFGSSTARLLMDSLEPNGFGSWVTHAHHRQVFRFVKVIRDAFYQRAQRDPRRHRRVSSIAATWVLDTEPVIDHALSLAIDGGDYELADKIFASLIIRDSETYTTDRFLPTLQRVPRKLLPDYPMLAFGLALSLNSNPLLRGEASTAFAIAADASVSRVYFNAEVDSVSLAGMRAVSKRLGGDYDASGRESLSALDLYYRLTPSAMEGYEDHLSIVLRELGYSLLQAGMTDDALSAFAQSVSLSRAPESRNSATAHTAGALAFVGNMRLAAAMEEPDQRGAWSTDHQPRRTEAMGVLARAFTHLDSFRFDAALDELQKAADDIAVAESWPFLAQASLIAHQGLGQGEAEAARISRDLLRPSASPGVGSNSATEALRATLASAWLSVGNTRAAREALEPVHTKSPHTSAARVLLGLSEQQRPPSMEHIETLVELPGHTIRTLAHAKLASACASLHSGDGMRTWKWLSAAAVDWAAHGVRSNVIFIPPRDRLELLSLAHDRKAKSVIEFLEFDTPYSNRNDHNTFITQREQDVLESLVSTDQVQEIARELYISRNTVKTHLQNIYRKLGATTRESALRNAASLGILPPPE